MDNNTLYLIYDDECPLCRSSAHAIHIKKAVGNLVLINARESHPLVHAAFAKGFDPDRGIIVIYHDQYYFGPDAVHFLAMMNSSHHTLNALAASLFRIKLFAKLGYPIVKSIRRLLLTMKGVSAISENKGMPLFASVFGDDWEKLSPFMQKRYSNRPYSHDVVALQGLMTIKSSRWMRLLNPLLKIAGTLVQQDGNDIPVKVLMKSEMNSAKYWFDREFKFTTPVHFKSYMVHIKENVMVEYMRFNLGWRTKYSVSDDKVVMTHAGYVFRFFNLLIPIPIGLLLGKCNIVERQISADSFSMEASMEHWVFGKIYEYRGLFTMQS